MLDNNSGDDVEDLVSRLQLQGLQYREFSPRKPAVLQLAGGRQGPAEVVVVESSAKPVAAAAAMRTAEVPQVSSQGAAAPTKVLATPVNFTFERLRRQAIGSRGDTVVISLHLPPRPAVLPSSQLLLQQPLVEVFSRLVRVRGPF